MTSEIIDWLSEKVPAFGGLPDREKIAIIDFAFLWSFFESHCLSNKANIQQIRDYVQQLPNTTVNSHEISQISSYFRARYIENGEYSHRFECLHLEKSGSPNEVTAMLRGGAEGREALIGCLAILYRYRNNLFHGEKWAYGIQEQKENFEQATSLLRWLMDQYT